MSPLPPYTLTRGNRRSISIQFDRSGKLIVKAPHLVPEFLIKKFVTEKADWIAKHHDKLYSVQTAHKDTINEGDIFLYLGKSHPLKFGTVSKIEIADALLFPAVLKFRVKKELHYWYQAQARTIITERVKLYAKEMNTDYLKLTFSDTLSKWGSCAPDNALQFSWRLVMAPLLVIDYVVVHELAHTRHHHHQRSFWKEVEKYKPAYKQYVKWLKEHSIQIHGILAK